MHISNDEEIVSFPVPKRLLPVVIHALAKAMPLEAPDALPTVLDEMATVKTDAVNGKIDWTQAGNIARLKKAIANLPIASALLDLTAEREGQLVPFADVVNKAGFTSSKSAKSSLGALTKIIKREFQVQYEDANWPVEHNWAAGGELQYYYRMTLEVAKLWRHA